jgi:hypothetical protein
MTQYNIYFGTIGNTLGCKYRFTKWCKNDQDANRVAESSAQSFYYKNEGKFGIPSYNQIAKEAEITGVDIEKLYKEHINDMMRFYAIPTEVDTISTKKLRF